MSIMYKKRHCYVSKCNRMKGHINCELYKKKLGNKINIHNYSRLELHYLASLAKSGELWLQSCEVLGSNPGQVQ